MPANDAEKPQVSNLSSSGFITLVKPAIINTGNGATTVPAGTSVRIISRHGNNVWIHYGDADYEISVDATDLVK